MTPSTEPPASDDTPTAALVNPAAHGVNYQISPDAFEKVISQLPRAQQDTLRFWYFLGKERNWSLGQLAKACGSSSTTLSRVFAGKYNADTGKLCADLAKARENFAESITNPEYIQTSLGERIFRICDRTRTLSTVTIIWGKMGIGKTTVLEEYKRQNNHGRTIYYRCSAGLTAFQFVMEIAKAAGLTNKKATHLTLRDRLFSVLAAGNRLLIIDELHQLFLRRSSNDITPVVQCEFLREIYDRANCGLVLVGTKALERHLVDQKEALAQLLDRGTMQIALPDKPSAGDLRAFIKNYGLDPLDERQPDACAIVADILKTAGLRMLTLRLRDGAATAAKRGEGYTWAHFIEAFQTITKLAK